MEIKTIGASGQISLGKQYAGRIVIVDELEEGVWMVKTAQVVPDSERWLHTPEARRKLDAAVSWVEKHPARATNLDTVEAKLRTRIKKRQR